MLELPPRSFYGLYFAVIFVVVVVVVVLALRATIPKILNV
jgi:hypothetical protein